MQSHEIINLLKQREREREREKHHHQMPGSINAAHTVGVGGGGSIGLASLTSTSTPIPMSRCPHVVLIKNDLVDANDDLKCHECGSRKHLWACLRADCTYIGCGRDTGGHSKQHAVRMYHPLAINLATRNVWCEICNTRVYLDRNEPRPPYGLLVSSCKLKMINTDEQRDPTFDDDDTERSLVVCDDFDIVNYLDQENGRGIFNLFLVYDRLNLFKFTLKRFYESECLF